MTRTDAQVLQDCIKRASYTVSVTNNPDTRMVLDALIEKQVKDERIAQLQAQLEAAREALSKIKRDNVFENAWNAVKEALEVMEGGE